MELATFVMEAVPRPRIAFNGLDERTATMVSRVRVAVLTFLVGGLLLSSAASAASKRKGIITKLKFDKNAAPANVRVHLMIDTTSAEMAVVTLR